MPLVVLPSVLYGRLLSPLLAVGVASCALTMAACASLSQTASTHLGEAGPPPRTCPSAVGSPPPPGWQASSLRAGSAWIYLWGAVADDGHAGRLAASRFPLRGRYDPTKTMVVVPAGLPVTLRVAAASSAHLRLAFQLEQQPPPVALKSGATLQRFVPCSSGRTYYNGGLLVAGPQCARLTVTIGDRPPVSVVAALGRRHCD